MFYSAKIRQNDDIEYRLTIIAKDYETAWDIAEEAMTKNSKGYEVLDVFLIGSEEDKKG